VRRRRKDPAFTLGENPEAERAPAREQSDLRSLGARMDHGAAGDEHTLETKAATMKLAYHGDSTPTTGPESGPTRPPDHEASRSGRRCRRVASLVTVVWLGPVGCANRGLSDALALAEIAGSDALVAAEDQVVCIETEGELACLWPEAEGARRAALGRRARVVGVATSGLGACVLDRRGRVRCTDGRQTYREHLGDPGVALVGSMLSYCALLDSGAVRCWGLHPEVEPRRFVIEAEQVDEGLDDLFAVFEWTCGHREDGSAWCRPPPGSLGPDPELTGRALRLETVANWHLNPESAVALATALGPASEVSASLWSTHFDCVLDASARQWVCAQLRDGELTGPTRLDGGVVPFVWRDQLCTKRGDEVDCRASLAGRERAPTPP